MSVKIDQKAYLQKYLGGPSKDKKKKKKKVKKAIKGNGFVFTILFHFPMLVRTLNKQT